MEDRAHAIAAVCFLIVFAFGIAAVFLWLHGGPPEDRIYQIASPYGVGGLQPQAEVKFKGLVVGHVKEIHFDPRDPTRVLIRIGVRPDAYITRATYAQLGLKGITGLRFITLKLAEDEAATPLPTSDEQPAQIPMRPGLLEKVEQMGQKTLTEVQDVLDNANELFSSANRAHLANAIAQLDTASRRLVELEKTAEPTLEALPEVAERSRAVLDEIDRLGERANAAMKNIDSVAVSVDNLTASTDLLMRRLTQDTLPEIHRLATTLSRTGREVTSVGHEIRTEPQSLVFGGSPPPPGPGEPGFEPPRAEDGR
jgi:phospholipid/cholesterol/gamma-HCH transport system substrate-binding protein